MSHVPLPDGRHDAGFLGWPSSGYGRRAAQLFGAAVASCLLLIGMTVLHFTVVEDDDGAPPVWLFVSMLATAGVAAVAAIAGGFLSLRALRGGDRSIVLFLPAGAAAIALFFILGEALFPH